MNQIRKSEKLLSIHYYFLWWKAFKPYVHNIAWSRYYIQYVTTGAIALTLEAGLELA